MNTRVVEVRASNRWWRIVWPEYRILSEDRIRSLYADAVANDDYGIEKGLNDPDEMARNLDSIGHITLGGK